MDGRNIGLDLCDSYTQLCCMGQEEAWTLPTVICRDRTEKEWLVGEEAYARALQGNGVIVDKLVKLVLKDGTATIAGIKYSGRELLTQFLGQVLRLPFLGEEKEPDWAEEGTLPSLISHLVITVPRIESRLVDCLLACIDALSIPRDRVHVISHTESFLYYVLSQKREVWNNQVGMFDLSEDCLCYYEMKVQRGMRQVTVLAEREKLEEGFSLDILDSPAGMKMADRILCSCGERLLQKKLYSSVFLTGKGFERQDWAGDFMRMICMRRKAYVEQSLFAQGAACKASDCGAEKTSYPYTMLCDGRLASTVSVKVLHRDQESQLVLAAAGDSWYESRVTTDFILDRQNYLEFMVAPLDPKGAKIVKMTLEGFPERKDKTLRVQVQIGFLDANTMAVEVKDQGFGDFYPSSGAFMRQEVRL